MVTFQHKKKINFDINDIFLFFILLEKNRSILQSFLDSIFFFFTNYFFLSKFRNEFLEVCLWSVYSVLWGIVEFIFFWC
jgi:hypothetical protein